MNENSKMEPDVILYTDGACSGNPGPGGWGVLLEHPASGRRLENSGGEPDTTNNRMELQAVIEGLSMLKRPSRVEIVSDSAYVLNGLETWMAGWKKNGWQRREKNRLVEVKNVDLWQRLDELAAIHSLIFTKIKGHSGHAENERCDTIARAAAKQILDAEK